jgi:hypothetical protein
VRGHDVDSHPFFSKFLAKGHLTEVVQTHLEKTI